MRLRISLRLILAGFVVIAIAFAVLKNLPVDEAAKSAVDRRDLKTLRMLGFWRPESIRNNRLTGSLLIFAIERHGDDVELIDTLLLAKPDLGKQDYYLVKAGGDGLTPLTTALSAGKFNVAKRLVEAGADVNERNSQRCPPLFYLIYPEPDRQHEMLAYLLEHGADPTTAEYFSGYSYATTLLARSGITNCAENLELLFSHGWDINKPNYMGNTIMHFVCENRHKSDDVASMIRILQEHGAEVDLANKQGITPLMMAARYYASIGPWAEHLKTVPVKDWNLDVIQTLITHGANADFDAKASEWIFRDATPSNVIAADFANVNGTTQAYWLVAERYGSPSAYHGTIFPFPSSTRLSFSIQSKSRNRSWDDANVIIDPIKNTATCSVGKDWTEYDLRDQSTRASSDPESLNWYPASINAR